MSICCQRMLISVVVFAALAKATPTLADRVAPAVSSEAAAATIAPSAAITPVRRQVPLRINRPWDLRYYFYVTDRWSSSKKSALNLAAKAKDERSHRSWEEVVDPTRFFQFYGKWDKPGDGLTVVVIEFAPDGRVKTPNSFNKPLYGHLDRHQALSLAHEEDGKLVRFHLGYWFTGLGDSSTHWAPGVCELGQTPEPHWETNEFYLYGPAFEITPAFPSTGCREWAYQLYDPDRPYIDVTSYIPKEFDYFPDGPGAYINPVVGWAGFNHPPKPVIGNDRGQWYCLHECPQGEVPGPIPDIQAWAARHGWSAPERPDRIPMFPDSLVADDDEGLLGEGDASDDPPDTGDDGAR